MYSVVDVRTLYLLLFHIFSEDSYMMQAERILNRIIEGDSDIYLSGDEGSKNETGEDECSNQEDPDEVNRDAEPDKVCRRPQQAKTNMQGSEGFNQGKNVRIIYRDVFQEIDPNSLFILTHSLEGWMYETSEKVFSSELFL